MQDFRYLLLLSTFESLSLLRTNLRPAGFAVFADFVFRFSSTGRDFLGLIWTRLGESYTVRYPAGGQGKGKSPRSPAKVENGHSGKMLQLEGGSRFFELKFGSVFAQNRYVFRTNRCREGFG